MSLHETDLSGLWKAVLPDGSEYDMRLPGTLDENGIGEKDFLRKPWHPDAAVQDTAEGEDKPIATRFTRKHTFEGAVRIRRELNFIPTEGKRVFLKAERARVLRLLVNGEEIPAYTRPTLNTPHIFELSGRLPERSIFTFISDNSYPGLPYDDIVYSSAATDETQTNWNGILGQLCLYEEERCFIRELRVLPLGNRELRVLAELDSELDTEASLLLSSGALSSPAERALSLKKGINEVSFSLPIAAGAKLWDEEEGNLYELTASLRFGSTVSEKNVSFGIRQFGDDGTGRLALNGRRIFLRSEANCAEFPEEGHCPAEESRWEEILKRFRRYGVNCMRFHSHCPPEAAFYAADKLGMLMQPELSHWNPVNAFESEVSFRYYLTELTETIKWLGNHPSFVMLSFGNELHAHAEGHARMDHMNRAARALDPTRLYINASNAHYGELGPDPESDFYTADSCQGLHLRAASSAWDESGIRGFLNNTRPNGTENFNDAVAKVRESFSKPVFGFEVGQFEVLPDFSELADFRGVSEPANLLLIRDRVLRSGLSREEWDRMTGATGEMSLACYQTEAEAVMRTEGMSGLSLLGLQDFPGQGTALVGMMNSHLKPKPFPFAAPERFRSFFTDQALLPYLPGYVFENGEELSFPVKAVNYGKAALQGTVQWRLAAEGAGKELCFSGVLGGPASFPAGGLTDAGILSFRFPKEERALRWELTLTLGELTHQCALFSYPAEAPACPASVCETRCFDARAEQVLAEGGIVYLSPASRRECFGRSIRAQYTPDFWSVGTFPVQEGGMGLLLKEDHPLFKNFPTKAWAEPQWWPMSRQRALILPERIPSIITELDSYAFLRPMTMLAEVKCGNGRLLFSSMGLQDLQEYPEARALLRAIYLYLSGSEFHPVTEVSPEWVRGLFPS